jgi:hypothetical protein
MNDSSDCKENSITEKDEDFADNTDNTDHTDKINCSYWEGLIDLDELLDDPILKVIDNPTVFENLEDKFKKAISILKKREIELQNRLDEASSNVCKILKYSSLMNFSKEKLDNIIEERKKNNYSNDVMSKIFISDRLVKKEIKKPIDTDSTKESNDILKNKRKCNKIDHIIDTKIQSDSNKKALIKTHEELNITDINFYQNIKKHFYTADGYISELFKRYFRIAENTKPFLENVFPGMNMEEVLNLHMKDFLDRIYEKNMTKTFVVYWFRDYIEYFNSISNTRSDIHSNQYSNP